MLATNRIYCGQAEKLLKEIDKDCCQLVLTSPPYDSVRAYKNFYFPFKEIATEIYRIIEPGGICVWVVNDQYIDGGRSMTSFKQGLFFTENLGFKMHDIIVYHKSGFNFPANNRYHQSWEFMFILSKGKPKTFNPLMDRKNKYVGQKAHGRHRGHDENGYVDMSQIVKAKAIGEFGKRTNVWYYKVGGGNVTKDKIAYEHPAIFPESLAQDNILSYTNRGDLVIDPLAGAGTTCKMAKINDRKYIGIEASEEYCKIAENRIPML